MGTIDTRGWLRARRAHRPSLSLVVPTLNEADNLAVVLPELQKVLDSIPGDHEVILVDGGSVEALTDGADFAKGSRFTEGGGSDDITAVRRAGNAFLNGVANTAFGSEFSDLCYGYNAFWTDMLPVLDLPDSDEEPPEDGSMVWGDGFEIETVINVRMAAADADIVEVPSVERGRIHGETNLRTFRDGLRVLRTILVEWVQRRLGFRTPSSQASRHRAERPGRPIPRSRRRTARSVG